jgi:hypothetical protein
MISMVSLLLQVVVESVLSANVSLLCAEKVCRRVSNFEKAHLG